MRCTNYMKEEIIRTSGEMIFRQYYEMVNKKNPDFLGMNEDNIIRANIRILEKKLSIDRIEVDNLLMDKIRHKVRVYLYAKTRQGYNF